MNATCKKIVCADRNVLAEQMLDTRVCLRAVRSYELRIGAKHRGGDSGNRCERATTSLCCEHAGRICIAGNLLERLDTVLLDCAV